MKVITLTQTVTYEVNFFEDDFNSKNEFDLFLERLKTDEDFMIECFIKNVNRDNLNLSSDITIK